MSSESDQRIRHVAIVLQSLDAATSRGLLSQLPPAQSKLVRQAMVSLGTINPREREAAFHSMQGLLDASVKLAAQKGDGAHDAPASALLAAKSSQGFDALEWSPAVGQPSASKAEPAPIPIERVTPLSTHATWEVLPLETLADVLMNERPIVIATVVNQLSNERAMQVLKLMPTALAGATLAAVPNLHLTEPAILQDIEQELHRKMGATRPRTVENQLGLAKLHAILSSVSDPERLQWQGAVTRSNPVLGARMGWQDVVESSPSAATSPTRTSLTDTASPVIGPVPLAAPVGTKKQGQNTTSRAGDDLFEERMVIPMHEHVKSQISSHASTPAEQLVSEKQLDASENDARPDLHVLVLLSDRDFVTLIHACTPQTVLLAVSGATREFVTRLERLMPKRDIPRLRARLQALGPISLRDIDAAQKSILAMAHKLAGQGKITKFNPTGFAIAA
jgi:flagellar motor switch protein FliG